MPDQFQSFSPLPISWPSLPVFVKVGRRNTRVATTRAEETRSLEACQTPLSPSTNRLRLYSQSFPLRIEPGRVRSCTRLRETWRNLVGLGGKGGGVDGDGEVAEVGHHVNCIPDCGLLKSGALHRPTPPSDRGADPKLDLTSQRPQTRFSLQRDCHLWGLPRGQSR